MSFKFAFRWFHVVILRIVQNGSTSVGIRRCAAGFSMSFVSFGIALGYKLANFDIDQVQEMGALKYFMWNGISACLSNDEYGPKNHEKS